ncbi:type II toxin-antitoxin system RelE/ParE family toxin [Sandaracinomonas limnophila]|uniref:Type II toxin-antitoxin system RelE/ParE family toxin n=1 Tax=Sandaracinomonas limnophila TaxID=1862386 RepID=A0A437PNH5_9BACT|nr:type II toxin-antitoxin system RelE/ParE family toxin [Sandaracinomonas limnophila]RVU23594.1 type II toxin-antitoxin system RelE/ParE family toxin [Sandaracinomonas limnophila]
MKDSIFEIILLEDVKKFLSELDEKPREKIIYNLWKSKFLKDKTLFKKLNGEIWEFRTVYNKQYFRIFAFWDKRNKQETLVVASHGLIKKVDKIPKSELEKANKIMELYFKN